MKCGSYQAAFSNDIQQNMTKIRKAAAEAAKRDVRLLLLPECALTGYPGEDAELVFRIDFQKVDRSLCEIESLSAQYDMHIVFGAAEHADDRYYNSVFHAAPGECVRKIYRKRALWGWDADVFSPGESEGEVIETDGFRIGVRICYEIRFPEYFRELYRQRADCAAVLFCDVSKQESAERYDLIKAHIKTRSVENVFPIVSVNNCERFQTAPTTAVDEDGRVIAELLRHEENLMIFDLEKKRELSFGAKGRKHISDALIFDD